MQFRRREPAAHGRELVAIGIAYIGGVKVRCVAEPKSGSPVAHASVAKSGSVELIDRFP